MLAGGLGSGAEDLLELGADLGGVDAGAVVAHVRGIGKVFFVGDVCGVGEMVEHGYSVASGHIFDRPEFV